MPETSFAETIADTPQRLLRKNIGLSSADTKMAQVTPVVYAIAQDVARAKAACGDTAEVIAIDPVKQSAYFMREDIRHGLLFLPYPYLVPGGRYNEMYGWDTAFPVFAYADTKCRIMREQVDNQLYQIRAYGMVLNANRTYYLSRSQPPLVSAMAWSVWQAAQKQDWKKFDPDGVYADAKTWLAAANEDLKKYYTYWTTGDRLIGHGLSRYWDEGDVPAPETIVGEAGHYDHARQHFEKHPDPEFFANGKLTPLYYRADRAMRASGFDPTGHWGYGGLGCYAHAPVCLNALLYRMEGDMAAIATVLGGDAATWRQKQATRLAAMQSLLLDKETGIYHDYDFQTKSLNRDPFATFFHALWAGLYDGDNTMARKAAASVLSQLETPYGISTSTRITGSQWDHPYGWPPLQYFAFEGLWRCGMNDEARRIAEKYIGLAKRIYAEKHSLFEKYNMQEGSTQTYVVHGYSENANESGTFLWTAATLKLAQDLLERKP